MRDPCGARPRDPRLSRSRERLRRGGDGRCRRASASALRRDARAHQGGRFVRSRARRAIRLCGPLHRGRRAPADRAEPPRRQRRDHAHRRQSCSPPARPISGSAAAPTAPITGSSPMPSTTRARNISRCASATSRPARTCPTASSAPPARRLGGRQPRPSSTSGSTTTTARRRSSAMSSAPTRETDVLVYEERNPGFFLGVGKTQSGRFILIDSHDHETSEVRIIDSATPDGQTASRRAGGERPRSTTSTTAGERFYILTNADGAEDFKIVTAPLGDAGPAPLARSRPAPARPADPQPHRLQGLSRPPRARERPAAHRHPPPRERRGARNRLRRGGLFARRHRRLRVRHDDAPLHLFVDDDADARLRLRHGDADAGAAQGGGDPLRPRSRRLRDAAHLRAGAGRRDGAGLAPLSPRDAARRQRALPPLRLRRLRHHHTRERSASRGCRWSTAASSTPSPMCAAARTRASAGMPTGGARRR